MAKGPTNNAAPEAGPLIATLKGAVGSDDVAAAWRWRTMALEANDDGQGMRW